jgi:hypothetical protein
VGIILINFNDNNGDSFSLTKAVDLRASFLDKQVILPAVDNLHLLTKQQTKLWNLYYPDGMAPHLLQKSDINPSKMVSALPNIWMFDLLFDDAGTVSEMNIRLHGTKLDEIYGSAVGDHYIVADYEEKMRKGEEEENARTIEICLKLAELQIPLIVYINQLSGDLSHLGEMNLIFPVCNNSDRVNLVFGHTEVMSSIIE